MQEIESWQNGKWVPNSQIGTRLWDAHYFFGWAVFDAFRTYNHVPHLMTEHIDRLYRSARLAEVTFEMNKKEMTDHVNEVIEHNKKFFPKEEEYRFMIFVSPGFFRIYDDMGDPGPIITINTTTTSRYAKHIVPFIVDGYTALVSSQRHIPSRFFDPKIKSCSRLHYGIADAEAERYGKGVWPILLDEYGCISESSGANVGFIKDHALYLPQDNNILRGCTMGFVEKIASQLNIDVSKGDWEVYDVLDADCVLFTSTFLGIAPSYKVIFRNQEFKLSGYSDKSKRRTVEQLFEGFSNSVGINIVEQWLEWSKKNNVQKIIEKEK